MSVEEIYNCISHQRIVPKHIDAIWDGFWNKESTMYSSSPSDHVDISIYRGEGKYYFEVYSYRKNIIENAIQIVQRKKGSDLLIEWIHNIIININFQENSITEEEANNLYVQLNEMEAELGIKKFGRTDQVNTEPFDACESSPINFRIIRFSVMAQRNGF